jgi:hypothetical protein
VRLPFDVASESIFYTVSHDVVATLLITKVTLNNELFFYHVNHPLAHNELHPPIDFLLHLFESCVIFFNLLAFIPVEVPFQHLEQILLLAL